MFAPSLTPASTPPRLVTLRWASPSHAVQSGGPLLRAARALPSVRARPPLLSSLLSDNDPEATRDNSPPAPSAPPPSPVPPPPPQYDQEATRDDSPPYPPPPPLLPPPDQDATRDSAAPSSMLGPEPVELERAQAKAAAKALAAKAVAKAAKKAAKAASQAATTPPLPKPRFAQELGAGGIDARRARLVVPLAALAAGLSTAVAMNPKMSPWWSVVESGEGINEAAEKLVTSEQT